MKEIWTWCGKPIDDMTREEAIEALKRAAEAFRQREAAYWSHTDFLRSRLEAAHAKKTWWWQF